LTLAVTWAVCVVGVIGPDTLSSMLPRFMFPAFFALLERSQLHVAGWGFRLTGGNLSIYYRYRSLFLPGSLLLTASA
jgi:hypothetical protein